MSSHRSSDRAGSASGTGGGRARGAASAGFGLATPIGVTLAVLGCWFAAMAVYGPDSDGVDMGGQLLMSLVLVFLLSGFHEIGHAVAGRLAGLRFRSLTVGPFSLVRRVNRYRVLPNRRWIRFAGCVEHDLTPGRTKREDLAISALGGPAANLLLACLIFACGATSAPLRDLAAWSSFFGVINLVPLRMNGQTSDGGLVLRCLSTSAEDAEWRTRAFGERRDEG